MIIDKEQLISLLKDKSGLDRNQVESQLSELVNRIQQAGKEGKTFEIEGFGVFSMEDGNLQFKPHGTLETEINNKYAGMKPIELIGAFKEPEGDEVPELPEEPLAHQDLGTENAEESEKWEFDKSAISEEEEPVEAPQIENDEEAKPSREAQDAFEKIFGKVDEQKEVEKKRAPSQKTVQQKTVDEAPKDPIGQWLVAAVIVLALGVGGWLFYDAGFLGSNTAGWQIVESPRESSQVADRQTEGSLQEVGESTLSQQNTVDKNAEPEQKMEVGNQEGNRLQAEVQQPQFGLRGAVNQSIGGYYTIVVHSLRSNRIAETKKKELQRAGFRSSISQAQVGGTTYFRVGIGQFRTVNDAKQAVGELPENYRENNFIKRFK